MRLIAAAAAAIAFSVAFSAPALAADTTFEHTYKGEGVQKIDYKGRKVAAVVIGPGVSKDTRIKSENVLAKELTARGMQGVAGHGIVPLANATPMTRERAVELLKTAGVAGVVVIELVDTEKKTVKTHWASSDFQQGLAKRNYFGPMGMEGDTFDRKVTSVTLETTLYSLEPYGLLWAGQSKSVNPKQVDVALPKFAAAVADRLRREGLVK